MTASLLAEVDAAYPDLDDLRRLYEVTRRLITALVNDAIAEARARLTALRPESADDVRHSGRTLIAFSDEMLGRLDDLRKFLFARVYRHARVVRIMDDAETVIADLFQRYTETVDALPPEWRVEAPPLGTRQYARYVADFIAGMTDRYALVEHRRLFDATPDLR